LVVGTVLQHVLQFRFMRYGVIAQLQFQLAGRRILAEAISRIRIFLSRIAALSDRGFFGLSTLS